jgi:hypothetical protein
MPLAPVSAMTGLSSIVFGNGVAGAFWDDYPFLKGRYDFTDLNTMYSATAVALDLTNYLDANTGAATAYPITLCGWGKTSRAAAQTVLSLADKDATNEYVSIEVDAAGDVSAAGSSAADGRQTALLAGSYTDGNWHFYSGVFANATSREVTADADYLNKVSNTTSVTIGATYDRTSVGRLGDSTPDKTWDGSIDNPAIFTAALTDGQLSWMYNFGEGRSYSDIVANHTGATENLALSFVSASSQYAEVASPAVTAYPFSVSLWFRSTASFQALWWCGVTSSNADYISIWLWSGDIHLTNHSTGSGSDDVVRTGTYADDEWHHVLAVCGANNHRQVWVDGVAGSLSTFQVVIGDTYDRTSLARYGDSTPTLYYDGDLDEVCVFNAKLDGTDALELYNAGLGVMVQDLVDSTVTLTSGEIPVHGWHLSVNEVAGAGEDIGSTGGFDMTLGNAPTDITGIPAGWIPPDPATCVLAPDLTENSGIRMDESSNELHLTPDGTNPPVAAAGVVPETAGIENRALTFVSASSEYVEDDTAAFTAYPFSISLWFKSTASFQALWWCGDKDSAADYASIWLWGGDIYLTNSATIDGSDNSVRSGSYADGEWHHVLAVCGANNHRQVWVDGVAGSLSTFQIDIEAVFDRTSMARYGDSTPDLYFDGSLDEVCVFHAQLDGTDALELYNDGIGVLVEDLVDGTVVLTSTEVPVHGWHLSENELAGAGDDIGTTGGVDLTLFNTPADADGIPAGQALSGLISLVEDQTTNNNDLKQATLSKRPEVITVSDGTGIALQFDGVDDYLRTDAFSAALASPNTLILGAESATPSTFFDGLDTSNEQRVATAGGSVVMDAGTANTTSETVTNNTLSVIAAVFNDANSAAYVDGGTGDTTVNCGSESLTGLTVGAHFDLTTDFFDGTYRQLVLNNGVLNTAQINSIGDHYATSQGSTWTDIT